MWNRKDFLPCSGRVTTRVTCPSACPMLITALPGFQLGFFVSAHCRRLRYDCPSDTGSHVECTFGVICKLPKIMTLLPGLLLNAAPIMFKEVPLCRTQQLQVQRGRYEYQGTRLSKHRNSACESYERPSLLRAFPTKSPSAIRELSTRYLAASPLAWNQYDVGILVPPNATGISP